MFELGKITDGLGGMLSGQAHHGQSEASSLAELLGWAGIDPAMLHGLSQEEIRSFLQQHGIDPGQVDPAQLGEAFQGEDIAGNLSRMASDWLASRGR